MRFGLTKRNSTGNEVDRFQRSLDALFDDFFSVEPTFFKEHSWAPVMDVEEDEKGIHVRAELPGMTENDINVQMERGMLTISGEKKEERTEKDAKGRKTVSERRYGSFCRSMALPEGVNSDEVKASFRNGVLTIDVPVNRETTKSNKIEIAVQ